MKPVESLEEAIATIDNYQGTPDNFELTVSPSLLDKSGLAMTIITDRILAKGWWPNGSEEKNGIRIFKYREMSAKGNGQVKSKRSNMKSINVCYI